MLNRIAGSTLKVTQHIRDQIKLIILCMAGSLTGVKTAPRMIEACRTQPSAHCDNWPAWPIYLLMFGWPWAFYAILQMDRRTREPKEGQD